MQNFNASFRFFNNNDIPINVEEEKLLFEKLQINFKQQFQTCFEDKLAQKTIVIIPSLTLDQEVLTSVKGVFHYEERMLCLLMLLRMPRTNLIFVSSMPIDLTIVDYYLHLLPGITGFHARDRLTLLSCYDAFAISLTEKILKRDRLIHKIKQSIKNISTAHISCFNVTNLERSLAVKLGLPIYGTDPDLLYWGTKSGSRKVFKEAGITNPMGIEDIYEFEDVKNAILHLKAANQSLRKVVIKLNDGFSGDGNAVFKYPKDIPFNDLDNWLNVNLISSLQIVSDKLSPTDFFGKMKTMGGIVEVFVDGTKKVSPSVQCRINPIGEVTIISTHDQVLGGESGQVFIGAHFPADEAYRLEIGQMGKTIANLLKQKGVIGRFAIDFISVFENTTWVHYAIEINLRKGGTTHPYLMMQFLTNGHYNESTGLFETPNGQVRYYFASDNVQNDAYIGLTPPDLIDIAMFHELHFDGVSQKGVMFHMIGALSQFGKIGLVCIGCSPQEAYLYYQKTIEVLDVEVAKAR